MADNEGIRSPFPTQPYTRSAKLRIYETLFRFNQAVDQLVAFLHGMKRLPFADKEDLQSIQAGIEEARCDINADFAEYLVDTERSDEARFSKQRYDYEKQWRDPDDVYINVECREEERKKQGLPPRLLGTILPYSAVADEEERWEAQQERKKRHAASRGKKAARAKNAPRGTVHGQAPKA